MRSLVPVCWPGPQPGRGQASQDAACASSPEVADCTLCESTFARRAKVLSQSMDIRAVAFDANGTLIRILADDDEERIFRAAVHFLTYQGIDLHRHELRDVYFQLMK